jgi:glycosyltransferase involved in cell wall biosynthesis
MMKKLISVIVPAYNEEDCIEELVRRLTAVFDGNPDYEFEAVIVENGSNDATLDLLRSANSADPRFKVVRLSRNFRMDGGITAGLDHINGDAAVIMTADLQDPPELISAFIAKWEEGYENVYMTVTKRGGTGPTIRFRRTQAISVSWTARFTKWFEACKSETGSSVAFSRGWAFDRLVLRQNVRSVLLVGPRRTRSKCLILR